MHLALRNRRVKCPAKDILNYAKLRDDLDCLCNLHPVCVCCVCVCASTECATSLVCMCDNSLYQQIFSELKSESFSWDRALKRWPER